MENNDGIVGKKIGWEGLGKYGGPIAGEVIAVAGDNLVVKESDGRAGFVHMEHTTKVEFLDDHSTPEDWDNWTSDIYKRQRERAEKYILEYGGK